MAQSVLCLGNALVDIIVKLNNNDFLRKHNLPKGSMQLVDSQMMQELREEISSQSFSLQTGGSAANTANGIANLRVSSAYISMVGQDELGDFYEQDLEKNNVHSLLFRSKNTITGSALTFISPDKERTFATYLGAAYEMKEDVLNSEILAPYEYFHIEGFQIVNHDLIRKAVLLSQEMKKRLSIDLASYNIVQENWAFLRDICRSAYVVFANEEEARTFTGQAPEEAARSIASLCEVAVVKLGKQGSLICSKGRLIKIPKIHCHCVDTNGAGDMYAAGFLSGLCMGKSLQECGEMAGVVAAKVITYYGAKIAPEGWCEVREELKIK